MAAMDLAAAGSPGAIPLNTLQRVGQGLRRPECVLATAAGDLFASHLGTGVVRIGRGEEQATIGTASEVDGQPFVPNGLALLPDGSFRIANMGPGGGLWRLGTDGALSPVLREVDGQPMGATNFVLEDPAGRLWISVSTRQWPISGAFRQGVADGHVILLEGGRARIVADGIAFANELRLDPAGRFLHVAETFGRRVLRYPLLANGSLGAKEVFTGFARGGFPDGMAFDEAGHLWVVCIIGNRVVRVAPDGGQTVVLEDCDPAHLDDMERRIAQGSLAREDMQRVPGRALRNISSIAFGGPDRRTAFLGSLAGDSLLSFRVSVPGHAPPHWSRTA